MDKRRFVEITHFLSKTSHVMSKSVQLLLVKITKKKNIKVYLAGTDKEKEGSWKTFYDGDEIQHLTWGPNRPNNDGDCYNCLMKESEMAFSGDPHHSLQMTKNLIIILSSLRY